MNSRFERFEVRETSYYWLSYLLWRVARAPGLVSDHHHVEVKVAKCCFGILLASVSYVRCKHLVKTHYSKPPMLVTKTGHLEYMHSSCILSGLLGELDMDVNE